MSSINFSKKQMKLRNAFKPKKPTEELLKTFRQMKNCFDGNELAVECFTLVQKLLKDKRKQDATIFIKKANKLLLFGGNADKCPDCSISYNFDFLNANVLNYKGSVSYNAKKYNEGLSYINLANAILTSKFDEVDESRCAATNCVLVAKSFNFYILHKIGMFTGKFDDSAAYAIKNLEIKKKLLKKDCIELAKTYLDVFFAYGSAMKYRDSLPYGLKALEIQIKHLGNDSVEVANQRYNLSFTYHQLGKHEKGLHLKKLSDDVLRNKGQESAEMLMDLRKYEEAISLLKKNISCGDLKENVQASQFISLAVCLYEVGNFSDAREHLKTAQGMIEKYPECIDPISGAVLFVEMSECYQRMNDTEAAMSLIKIVLAVPDLPHHLLSKSLSRLISLTPESGKAREEIPDMLVVVEKLKEVFGPESREVGYVYSHLGVAYWNSGQQDLGVKFLGDANSILDATIGPNHINSLKTSHTLSEFYGKMGRCARALEIEEKIVSGLKNLPPSELGFVREVSTHLTKMKERVTGSPTSTTAGDISDDGNDTYVIS